MLRKICKNRRSWESKGNCYILGETYKDFEDWIGGGEYVKNVWT